MFLALEFPLLSIILIVSFIFGVTLFMGLEPPEEENQPPQLTVAYPSEEASLSGLVEISASVLDEENLTADIYIDGELITSANEYNWDTTEYPDGRHTLRFYVAGGTEQSDTEAFEVLVDNIEDSTYTSDIFNVMVYNVKESGENSNWIAVVKQENPDILVLVETGYFDDDANEDLNSYTSEFNEYFVNEAPYESYTAYVDSFPTTGEAILSRFPIISFTQIDYVPLDDGSN